MKKFDTINVIPFIDIMLVLLAIVLATATFISQGKIEVDVPKSHSSDNVSVKEIVDLITINEEGHYFYKDKAVTLKELQAAVTEMNPDTKVTLKIDAKTGFQYFISVTDMLKKIPITKISVVTSEPSSKTN